MVASYTSRKRFEKQNPGENSNTWGGYLNSNTIDMIDEAFGVVCVAMTTAGDSTLDTANGATDSGRRSQIILTGTPTSNVSLFVPAVQSFYLIRNKMAGAFKVAVRNAGGVNGVDFSGSGAGSEQGVVISDGTNVREVLRTSSIGSFSALTSAVIAAVSNVALDTTGGAEADLLMFHDASDNGALNHVPVSTFFKNVHNNATAKTSVGLTDSFFLYNADATAMQSATWANVFKGLQSTTTKTTLVSADIVGVLDSADTNNAKRLTVDEFGHNILRLHGASQAIQEAATNTSVAVTPGVQHYHPGSIKAWGAVSVGSTVVLVTDYGLSSITDNGVGDVTFTFDVAFSSKDYASSGMCQRELSNSALWPAIKVAGLPYTVVAGSQRIQCASDGASDTDPKVLRMVFAGDV